MSVFTHGVDKEGKPAVGSRNQVFPVYADSERTEVRPRALA
jgi:hypothetical protein